MRVELWIAGLTAAGALAALVAGGPPPLGIVLGGGAAWLDFTAIRRLIAAAFLRHGAAARVVPLALVKSLVLIVIPAAALLVSHEWVDGMSFAIGVTTLPLAIVIAALTLPSLSRRIRDYVPVSS